MSGKTLGRNPGEHCTLCTKGFLVARFQEATRNEPPRAGGPPGPEPYLHHLVCSHCGVWHESAVHGGMTKLMQDQLKGFQNPEVRPEQCPKCSDAITEFTLRNPFYRRSQSLSDSDEKKVACCAGCVLLVWDIPTKMDEVMAKMHDSHKDKNTPP